MGTLSKVEKTKLMRLKKALPARIAVLGQELSVCVVDLPDGDLGDFEWENNSIRISRHQSIKSARATLLHEALHAALAISGQRELLKGRHEESLVRMLEGFLADRLNVNNLATKK